MKRLLLLVFAIFATILHGYAQPVVNRSGAANTVSDYRLQAKYNLFAPRYTDTTQANTLRGVDSCYAIIGTYDVDGFWYRECFPAKRWVRFFDASTPPTVNQITLISDNSVTICGGTDACDTLTFVTEVVDPTTAYLIAPDSLVVCNATVCDTVAIPRQAVNLYQNALTHNSGITEWGGELLHNTEVYTGEKKILFRGHPVYDYLFRLQNIQRYTDGNGLQSWLAAGNGAHPTAPDYGNSVPIGLQYTGAVYSVTPEAHPGYFGDKIGYFLGTNTRGQGYNLATYDDSAKVGGILFHTLDNTYTDAVTLYGAPAPNAATIDSLDLYRILTAHTNKNLTFYGYPSSRNDGVLTKVLGTDASGNVLLGTVAASGGGGVDTSGRTYYALNGLKPRNDSTIVLGGYLDENTRIKGLNTYFMVLDSLSGLYVNTYLSGFRILHSEQGDSYEMAQYHISSGTLRNQFYWNTTRMYFYNYLGQYSFDNLTVQPMSTNHLVAVDNNDLIYKVDPATLRDLPVTTSATTLTLSAGGVYIFSGSTATWTIPAPTGLTGRLYYLYNNGTDVVTLSYAGGGTPYAAFSGTTPTSLAAGGAVTLVSDGVKWLLKP